MDHPAPPDTGAAEPADEPVALAAQIEHELRRLAAARPGEELLDPHRAFRQAKKLRSVLIESLVRGDLSVAKELDTYLLSARRLADRLLPPLGTLAQQAAAEVNYTARLIEDACPILDQATLMANWQLPSAEAERIVLLTLLKHGKRNYLQRMRVHELGKEHSGLSVTPRRVGQILQDLHERGLVAVIERQARGGRVPLYRLNVVGRAMAEQIRPAPMTLEMLEIFASEELQRWLWSVLDLSVPAPLAVSSAENELVPELCGWLAGGSRELSDRIAQAVTNLLLDYKLQGSHGTLRRLLEFCRVWPCPNAVDAIVAIIERLSDRADESVLYTDSIATIATIARPSHTNFNAARRILLRALKQGVAVKACLVKLSHDADGMGNVLSEPDLKDRYVAELPGMIATDPDSLHNTLNAIHAGDTQDLVSASYEAGLEAAPEGENHYVFKKGGAAALVDVLNLDTSKQSEFQWAMEWWYDDSESGIRTALEARRER